MLKELLILLIGLWLVTWSCQSPADDMEVLEEELEIRKGLPNFINAVKAGEEVTVAYLGGSITMAEGWRVQSFQWMKEYFNNENIHMINAAIGGTPSNLAVFRVGEDVIAHDPDLVFVEFACNDSKSDSLLILRSFEGIVRQIWKANKSTGICFIYTVKDDEDMLGALENDYNFKSIGAMEKIADHYGIPSINFGYEIKKRLNDSSLIFTGDKDTVEGKAVFTRDGVHPRIETGHRVYTRVLKRCLKKIEENPDSRSNDLPSPISQNDLESATQYIVQEHMLHGNWERIDTVLGSMFPEFLEKSPVYYKTDSPRDSIVFQFEGDIFGLRDVMGPGTGEIEIQVDDTIINKRRFDPYSHFYRPSFFLLWDIKRGKHEVVIKLSENRFNKLEIINLKKNWKSLPAIYKENSYYVSHVLVNGEIKRASGN